MSSDTLATSRSWRSLLIDVAAIIFSVLLALALDDWWQRQLTKDKVDTVLATIRFEVEQNKAEVERALAYHRPMVEEMADGRRRLATVPLENMAIDLRSEAAAKRSLERLFRSNGRNMFEEIRVARGQDDKFYAKIGDREVRLEATADTLFVYGEGNIQLRPARILNYAWETALATQAAIHIKPELVASMTELSQYHQVHNDTVSRIIDMLYGGGGSIVSALQDLVYFEQLLFRKYETVQQMLDEAA